MKFTQPLAIALLIMSYACASAQEVKVGNIMIDHAWARATPLGAKVGGGYLTIKNTGAIPDRLISASSPAASKVEVHEMAMDKGVMKMRPVNDGLSVAPGQSVTLAPGGYHFMMIGLRAPLKKGETVPLTLKFEKAGEVKVTLDIEGIGAMGDRAGQTMHGMQQPMSK